MYLWLSLSIFDSIRQERERGASAICCKPQRNFQLLGASCETTGPSTSRVESAASTGSLAIAQLHIPASCETTGPSTSHAVRHTASYRCAGVKGMLIWSLEAYIICCNAFYGGGRLDWESIFPFRKDFAGYNGRTFKDDFLAAMTVAIVVLPQSMAYALIAGVDPVYGIYASIVAVIVAALFGSSNHLVTGPTNAIALMVAATMKEHTGAAGFYEMLFLLTLLVGVIQTVMALLKLGKLTNLVSHSVIVGFTAGAGVIIGLGQLNVFFGITLPGGYHPLYEKVWLTLSGLGGMNVYSLGIAATTVVIVLGSRMISRHIPGALLALIISAFLVGLLGLGDKGVNLVGDIPSHLPQFSLVTLTPNRVLNLFGGALAIAIVGLVEAISISKSIALNSEQRINPSREFLGQGLSNIAGAFFGCIASSGSFTRSAINYSSGARTKAAAMLSGVIVAVTLVAFASYARFIPNASLAAVIMIVAYQMVNQHAMHKICKASRYDMAVMLITIGATILMPDLEKAILTGIAVSIIAYVWATGETRVSLLEPRGDSSFGEVSASGFKDGAGRRDIAMVHIEGNLFFGSVGDLEDKLRQVVDQMEARIYILRLKRVQVLDISAFEVVESFIEKTLEKKKFVVLCGVSPTLRHFLDRIGLSKKIGEDNLFMAEDTVYASSRKAYQKAVELLKTI
jgi:sulfate permease, SulP family